MLNRLKEKIYSSANFTRIAESSGSELFYTGLRGSLVSFLVNYLSGSHRKIVYCSNDHTKLFRLKDDINLLAGSEAAMLYISQFDEEFEADISPLSLALRKISGEDDFILLTTPETLNKSILSEDSFSKNILTVSSGAELDFEQFVTRLNSYGFTRKKMVEEENDFAVRGGIVDIYPENLRQPVRLEFFGNTIESIREFDLATQRSIAKINSVEILPSVEALDEMQSPHEKLISYLKPDTFILLDEPDLIKKDNEDIYFASVKYRRSYISGFPLIKSEAIPEGDKAGITEIVFDAKTQPAFNSNTRHFTDNLKQLSREGYSMYISCSDDYQLKRMKELVEELDEASELEGINYLSGSIHEGFILPDAKTAVYTEHEVFSRYFRPARRKRKFDGITFKELGTVNYGDFMVHQNFGVGKYAGLKKIVTGGVEQEAVKLLYKDNDMVFVNLNSIHLIKKFSAQEGVTPKLNKLGGTEWERIKQKTKKKILEIAQDLIELYSKRKAQKGFRFSADSIWQKELEASFMYEDTPDQASATEAVKRDMETEHPMDRLVCGDVGFGKTEVAVRAAFKAVVDNKQVAVLVPTTILAEQHYNTFKDRLSPWATEVDHLSRFKTKKEQKEILTKLENGNINIIIGTHRLLSKDVKFKDLGLLIIDEEQRFGVKAKEKLKFMRENVDVLTLTATPIPRTLNFSLLGARDLSIINTPPKNRQPIHTEIINFDKKVLGNAIMRELQRGGQVYFVNDKISKLDELAEIIEEITPYAKVAVAHGQMSPAQLENVMMRFLEKKSNVLLCTKIIESGLDIPSVNTIIINRADNFGLAELYQLRGRVGRSNLRSFAYLVTPPQSVLTRQAVRRLHALEEFSELGSGMNLALKDLEIRGAGNLLGKEQSGFIGEIGFDMYMQLLDEAVSEINTENLPVETVHELAKRRQAKRNEVLVESDISMYIPEEYIDDENARLEIYKKMSSVNSTDELKEISEELVDRFGKQPSEVESLVKHIELKLLLSQNGFEKLSISGDVVELFFDLENQDIYTSGYFEKVMNRISQDFKNTSRVKQTKKSLSIQFRLPKYENSDEKLAEILKFVQILAGLKY